MELPSFWIRFPPQSLSDVMEATFKLLKAPLSSNSSSKINAIQCLACVDPKTVWFEKWCISSIGRTHCSATLLKIEGLLPQLVQCYFEFSLFGGISNYAKQQLHQHRHKSILKQPTNSGNNNEMQSILSSSNLMLLEFLHAAAILSKLTQFSAGRLCFPILLPNTRELFGNKIPVNFLGLFELQSQDGLI